MANAAVPAKIVVSASRRTDIPAFYMDWFFRQLKQGTFEVENPYNRCVRRVPATVDAVHSFVFWSKNFGPFLDGKCGEKLLASGYHLFFNFSINSVDFLLEPKVPPLSERLEQLALLCRSFGPKSVTWRFDPICFYRVKNGALKNNLADFEKIAEHAAACGVTRCVTSFLDRYGKVRRRAQKKENIVFEEICQTKKAELLRRMARVLAEKKIALSACCEKEMVGRVNDPDLLSQASCIPNDLLMALFGGKLSLRSDGGQRVAAGCGCKISMDIGTYRWHPCRHDCLFCYANPACDNQKIIIDS